MSRILFICSVILCISGCGGPMFTNLGNGVGVPAESIDDYAEANEMPRSEAKKRMLAEWNEKQQTGSGS
ncbi:hypothetical protein ACFL2H_09190 [Planctomycetota bacterium]